MPVAPVMCMVEGRKLRRNGAHFCISFYFSWRSDSLSFSFFLSLGRYKVGVVDGGSNAVLEYLKEDLSDRVDGIKDAQDAVGIKLATIESDVTAKLNAQNVKAAADLKRYNTYFSWSFFFFLHLK